jgi:hypothetical protein
MTEQAISEIVEDLTSIGTHGKWEFVIQDDGITSETQAQQVGQAIIDEHKDPRISIKTMMSDEDINVGDIITLKIDKEGYNDTITVAEMTETIYPYRIEQEVTFENYRKNLVLLMGRLKSRLETLERSLQIIKTRIITDTETVQFSDSLTIVEI